MFVFIVYVPKYTPQLTLLLYLTKLAILMLIIQFSMTHESTNRKYNKQMYNPLCITYTRCIKCFNIETCFYIETLNPVALLYFRCSNIFYKYIRGFGKV